MVRSLIYQLVAKGDGVPDFVQKLYTTHLSASSQASPPRLEEWTGILLTLLQGTERPYIFIDALDECAEPRLESLSLRGILSEILTRGGEHAKLLATSRPSSSLGPVSLLKDLGFIHAFMGEGVVNGDIELHLKARLQNDTSLTSFGLKAKEMIISGIVSKSAGM